MLLGPGRTLSALWWRPVALLSGLLFATVDWFSGPPASSWIGRNGLGWAATIVVAAVLHAVLPRTKAPVAAAPAEEPEPAPLSI